MSNLMKIYRDRWQLVEEIETHEQRSATIAERWQQLNTIVGMGKSLGLLGYDDPEEELFIHKRWQTLHSKMRAILIRPFPPYWSHLLRSSSFPPISITRVS